MIARLVSLTLVLLVVFAASRALVRALPGDPIETLVAETGTQIPREELRREFGLDEPFFPSLARDIGRAARGDLGVSLISRESVSESLGSSLARSGLLAGAALLLAAVFSLALGLLAAQSPATPLARAADRLCSLHGALAAALPTPWLGPILIYTLAVKFPLVPIGNHLLLPALTLAISLSGFWARLVRERIRETLILGSARGARARGVPEYKIALKYGLAPASGALIAYLGTQAGALLAGTFVVEVVFDWPGMGSMLIDAVLRRDYPVVQAAVFAGAACALGGTAIGDLLQALIDPRRSRA